MRRQAGYTIFMLKIKAFVLPMARLDATREGLARIVSFSAWTVNMGVATLMMVLVIVLLAIMGTYVMPHVPEGALVIMVFVKTMVLVLATLDLLEMTAVWSAALEMGGPPSGEYMVRVTPREDVAAMLVGLGQIATAMTSSLAVIEALAATPRARACAKTSFRARVVRCVQISILVPSVSTIGTNARAGNSRTVSLSR